MVTFQKYQPSLKTTLSDMMVPYMAELASDIPEDIIRGKLSDFIETQQMAERIHIAFALYGEKPVGFSVYQIDTPESDWCKRPGWGFIREFYIMPEYRKNGFGTRLAAYTEENLKTLGAEKLYLTSGPAAGFWENCGWENTGAFGSNGLTILEKYRNDSQSNI